MLWKHFSDNGFKHGVKVEVLRKMNRQSKYPQSDNLNRWAKEADFCLSESAVFLSIFGPGPEQWEIERAEAR